MKGVIYARYSSDNQREESIEGQLRECKAFAEKNDIQIIETYIDRALSARTDRRPDFQRMIKDSSGKKFEVVIVWNLDRFARDKYDSAHYKRILKNNGVKVISATEAISAGAEGILLESMLEGMAEYYSAELSEKVMRGLTENALKCKYNGGTLPIGYIIDSEQYFQIDPLTAPAVLDAFKHYAEGASMREITDEMNLKGVRTKRGGKISINSVTRMLHNRKYIGEYKFGDTVIENGVPRIISDDLFNAVQNKIAQNKKAPARKKAIDEYLLTTKLFCGKCGAMMVGESGHSMTGRVYQYYRCVHTKKVKTCDKKPVRKDWIEDLVVAEAIRILSDQGIVEQLADRLYEMQGEENAYLQSLRRSLSETEKSLSNVMRAIEQGIITETTKVRLMELEEERKKTEGEIGAELLRHPGMTREEILFGIEKFAKLDTSTQDGRRKLIDGFINSVYLYDDKAVINFNGTREARTVSLEEVESSGSADKPQPKSEVSERVLRFFCALRRAGQASRSFGGECLERCGTSEPIFRWGMPRTVRNKRADLSVGNASNGEKKPTVFLVAE